MCVTPYNMKLLLYLLLLTTSAYSQAPQLFQTTTAATAPGDAVLIRGEYLDRISQIQVSRLNDDNVDKTQPVYLPLPEADAPPGNTILPVENKAITVSPLQRTSQSLKFIIPKSYQPGVYSVRLTDNNKRISGFYVNVPKVNWAISDEGLNTSAGGTLRIQGKNLLRKNGQVVIISADKKQVIRTTVAKAYDDFSVAVTIPNYTPRGTYDLYYHNGQGGRTAWSAPIKITVISKTPDQRTINVKDYGAKGDGRTNDTKAFQTAVKAGGNIFIPSGEYLLTEGLTLPPNTVLKGVSSEATRLSWKIPGIVIQSTDKGNITMENLSVKQVATLDNKWFRSGLLLKGSNLKVRNCRFNCSGMYNFVAASGFIQKCRFETNSTEKTFMAVHPKGLIFEDCYKQSNGYGYATSIDESNNLYEARNEIPYNYINDREVMTFDGGSGAYAGPVASAKGNIITLPVNAVTNQWTPGKWIGGGVFILEGKGAGQYRRITNHTTDIIQLDKPFLVDPDATSVISITTIRKNLHFVNNSVTDGGAYQLYGSAQNCVIAGLKMRRCIGIISRGSLIYKGKQPEWYNDIVNCELSEGNATPKVAVKTKNPGYQSITIIGSGGVGMNIGTLVRRNKLSDLSYIRTSPGANPNAVTDVIIEDNSISTADKAIILGGSGNMTSNILIHNNHFRNVNEEVNTGLKQESFQIIK